MLYCQKNGEKNPSFWYLGQLKNPWETFLASDYLALTLISGHHSPSSAEDLLKFPFDVLSDSHTQPLITGYRNYRPQIGIIITTWNLQGKWWTHPASPERYMLLKYYLLGLNFTWWSVTITCFILSYDLVWLVLLIFKKFDMAESNQTFNAFENESELNYYDQKRRWLKLLMDRHVKTIP